MNYKVSPKRHLGKTISYRLISTLIGFLMMWYITGSIKIGTAFGVAEMLLKPIIYYIHERLWYKFIKFGLIEDKQKKKINKVLIKEVFEDTEKVLQVQDPIIIKDTGKKVLNYSSNR